VVEDAKVVYLARQLEGRNPAELTRLLQLSDDLGRPQDDTLWDRDYLHLFISHSAVQRELAGRLREKLKRYFVDGFVAHDSIEFGLEWPGVIIEHLRSCHALLALVSAEFSESQWCDQEVGWVLGRGVPVMSINAGSVPYGFFGSRQALTFRDDHEDVSRQIFECSLKLRETGLLATGALVTALEKADNYDEASRIVSLLASASMWDDGLIARATRAPKHNAQVRKADWGKAVGRLHKILSGARVGA
jgi:hypothetical protein